MGEERMMILKMLEEGKVSNEEALKLLEALDESDFSEKSFDTDKRNTTKNDKENFEDKLEKKIEKVTEDITENATDYANNLTDKVLNMVNDVVDNGSFLNFFGNFETITENIQKDISNLDYPTIDLEGINGKIIITQWHKNIIDVSATCRIKKSKVPSEKIYSIYEKENSIMIKPKFKNNLIANLEVKLPKKNYKLININSTNGKLVIDGLNSENIDCTTSNSSIYIENINSSSIKTKTRNGKIKILKTNAKNIDIDTSNASIILDKIMTKDASAKTTNGKIYADGLSFDGNSKVNLKTTNGKIEVHTNNYVKDNLSVDAKTSLGKIDLSIPNLIYEINDVQNIGSKRILAYSKDYKDSKGTYIKLSTSNGSIKIC
ncbi:MAG: hypothetical protein FH751_08545 [Firmicutes bacterium]|nr:hypothetical protein [Bacillota bacterium]